jgi:DNA-binding XRE family transcriptional regulator
MEIKMNAGKRKKLEAKGWKVTSVTEFLELTPEESALIELRLALSNALKQKRLEAKMTQEEFAKRLRSSQSRLAKMEAGDPSVSFDLLIKNLFATGIDKEKLGEIIAASA